MRVHAFKDDGRRKSVRRLDGCESSKKMIRLILFFVFFRKGWWLSSIKARKKEIGAESENKGRGGLFS